MLKKTTNSIQCLISKLFPSKNKKNRYQGRVIDWIIFEGKNFLAGSIGVGWSFNPIIPIKVIS